MQQNNINNLVWGVRLSRSGYGELKNVTAENSLAIHSIILNSQLDSTYTTGFYLNDGTLLAGFDDQTGGSDWGRGSTPLGGAAQQGPLPERLILTYYDAFDDYKVYQLDVQLPTEKIREAFTKIHRGMGDNLPDNTPNVYRNIELAFAPKGWIILFVTGPGIRKEIASWQAKVVTPSDEVMNEVTYNYYGKVKRGEEENIFRKDFKQTHPELYRRLETGEWKISSDWYKMMQTKFPWNLEVVAEGAKWTGEYYIEYANTDKYETLSDQVAQHKTELKPVPTKITTWVITNKSNEKYYIEFHMFPIPNWLAPRYTPYYQDPNLTYFFKRFQYFYPKRSLATNNQPAKPEEFATLKIHMTDKGYMDEIYLQKGTEKLPIEGAYEYYISEVDPTRGGYLPYLDGVDYYRTKPKIKDLSDPLFVDLD